jgi:hypothetical protein
MILRTLTQNSALLLIAYPITILLILFSGVDELAGHWSFLAPTVEWGWSWFAFLFLLLFASSIFINNLYNQNELYAQPSYLVGWIYALGSSIALVQFPQLQFWLGEFSLIIACTFLFQIFRQKRVYHLILLASLFSGVAFLLNPIYIFLLLVILVGINLTRPFSIRETFLLIIGFLLPWIYLGCYQYAQGLEQYWELHPEIGLMNVERPLHLQFQFWLFLIIIVLAIIGVLHKDDRQTNKTQQSKNIILLLVLVSSSVYLGWSIWNAPKQLPLSTMPWLLIWGHYWTHYRTSLLAPIFFYLWLITNVLVFLHWV